MVHAIHPRSRKKLVLTQTRFSEPDTKLTAPIKYGRLTLLHGALQLNAAHGLN
jgi:hypothetical protein